MHIGKSYSIPEFLHWTRRSIYWSVLIAAIAVSLFELLHLKWVAIPWTVVALLGTTAAFIVGFKNLQTYNRTWEARQIWGSIVSSTRSWGIMCRDFLDDKEDSKNLIYRHFAWLTALRYQFRDGCTWGSKSKADTEYQQKYSVPEEQVPLQQELVKYLSATEIKNVLTTTNPATQIMSLQSKEMKDILRDKKIESWKFVEIQKIIREFFDQQARAERIKNFPFPRQYATVNTIFVRLFSVLLPFGLLHEFDNLNDNVHGVMEGKMVWLVIPFSVLIAWVFGSLAQVGESTENPFEGGANDVPISQMSRSMEIELREMLGETELPPTIQPSNNIVL